MGTCEGGNFDIFFFFIFFINFHLPDGRPTRRFTPRTVSDVRIEKKKYFFKNSRQKIHIFTYVRKPHLGGRRYKSPFRGPSSSGGEITRNNSFRVKKKNNNKNIRNSKGRGKRNKKKIPKNASAVFFFYHNCIITHTNRVYIYLPTYLPTDGDMTTIMKWHGPPAYLNFFFFLDVV